MLSSPQPDSQARLEALRLIRRLKCSKSDWPTELARHELRPHLIDALQAIFARQVYKSLAVFAAYTLLISFFSICLTKGTAWIAPVVGMALVAATSNVAISPRYQGRYTLYALTQTDEVRVLGALIGATSYPWAKHSAVIRAIKRLLSRVTDENAGLLNREQQNRLWEIGVTRRIHHDGCDTAFALCTLRALSHIGNSEMLARMQWIGRNYFDQAYPVSVIELARQLTPLMEARIQRQQVPETLLRASNLPANMPDTLLRATSAATPEPPEQLLRASASERPSAEA